ncbi:hypothetical protein [Streptomyces monashensis]|uniref:hypothetical protein n=1 Tax=Streptomyces monashensis TaxID=1678012 RepID=UPI003F541FEB
MTGTVTVTAQGPLPGVPALGVAMFARLGVSPALGVARALPDGAPAAVYEPRIGADRAAERRARFRTAVQGLLAP